MIDKYNLAYRIEPESLDSLMNGIKYLLHNRNICNSISNNAKYYADKFLNKENILSDYENKLIRIVSE